MLRVRRGRRDAGVAARRRNRELGGILEAIESASPRDGVEWLTGRATADARTAFGMIDSAIYLVDPRGDWMMRAPADPDPAKLKRDIDRLLRASASWDQAGR